MINNKVKLSYSDVCIVPDVTSKVETRKHCNVVDENGFLPMFTAPMNTVVDEYNIPIFIRNNINVVIPRTIPLDKRFELGFKYDSFVALSLEEAKLLLTKDINKLKICIDIADGHMLSYIQVIKQLKETYGDKIIIMGGNIANPETYKIYNEIGCDYVRCGIGGGDACLTSSNTGIHYPYFSLLEEIFRIKSDINGKCKIIADGNIKGYSDIQKALIFADYVMIGSLFNKALESAGKTTYGKCYFKIKNFKVLRPIKTLMLYGRKVNQYNLDILKKWKNGEITLWKEFYGMSTKKAQKAINPNAKMLKTSEGLIKKQKVEYTLAGWVNNEIDYLKSAMSYCNSYNLLEYKDSEYVISLNNRFNK